MIIRAGFLLFVLSCVKTTDVYNDVEFMDKGHYIKSMYSSKLTQLRKRNVEGPSDKGATPISTDNKAVKGNPVGGVAAEGGIVPSNNLTKDGSVNTSVAHPEVNSNTTVLPAVDNTTQSVNSTSKANGTLSASTKPAAKATDTETLLHSPGVVKRGLIVFGGFALLAIAYFVFYRRKGKKYDANNSHNTNDTNQFRYGVLQSEDRRDNLELSRIPLTMESDEDDEEDLEIFDLEQKRKSLSYVNLQTNDEDIVLRSSKDESKNNLLLDIEDGPSDTLINWSNSGNNSIL